ncbi:MAG: glycosyltransferase family 9 protein [Nitrospiraceae bacterium]
MPTERALLIQLARLGDLVQSLPAYIGVQQRHPQAQVDLVCAEPLAPLARCFPAVGHVIPWDGAEWNRWAAAWSADRIDVMREAREQLTALFPDRYDVAYNLNQHSRAIALAHLCARQVEGPGQDGAVSEQRPAWAEYVREVARTRGANRVHLADAFCGLCGVRPPAAPPRLSVPHVALPGELSAVGNGDGPWVAIAVGAGDAERVSPYTVWREWISRFLSATPTGQVVLIGAGTECVSARAIQEQLSSLEQGRVWDATGKLSIVELAVCLARCQWVIGGDTGPLHLGAAVGVRAVGWYLARARVHETGPYGKGHMVWQIHQPTPAGATSLPHEWPIQESIDWIVNGMTPHDLAEWTVWRSHVDEWGACFVEAEQGMDSIRAAVRQRAEIWRVLSPALVEVAS